MKTLNKATLFLSKFFEILYWLGALFSAGLVITTLVARNWLEQLLQKTMTGAFDGIKVGGLELVVTGGKISMSAFALSAVAGIVIASLFAMIFRNVYLILKTAQGKTWFSQGDTPFQKDIVRMLREIGIFLLSTCAVDLLWSIGLRFFIGVDNVELSIGLEKIILGMMVLCLTQFFDYGSQLQKDVDGLL